MNKDTLSKVVFRPVTKIKKIYSKTLMKNGGNIPKEKIKLSTESGKRLLVLAYHANIDREMTMILSYYFAYRHNRKEIWELQELVFNELGFEIKRRLIKKLKFFNGDNSVQKTLKYLNQARNAVAHSPIWSNPRIKQSGEKALTKKVIFKIENDYQELHNKFMAFDFALREGLDIKHFG